MDHRYDLIRCEWYFDHRIRPRKEFVKLLIVVGSHTDHDRPGSGSFKIPIPKFALPPRLLRLVELARTYYEIAASLCHICHHTAMLVKIVGFQCIYRVINVELSIFARHLQESFMGLRCSTSDAQDIDTPSRRVGIGTEAECIDPPGQVVSFAIDEFPEWLIHHEHENNVVKFLQYAKAALKQRNVFHIEFRQPADRRLALLAQALQRF